MFEHAEHTFGSTTGFTPYGVADPDRPPSRAGTGQKFLSNPCLVWRKPMT
jgi:hypothetical protein